jgi:phosphatidylglycerophosphate synthase
MGYQHDKALKPIEVEEPVDFYLYRRIAAYFVRLVYETRITPNQITLLSLAAGLAGAICLREGWILPSTAGLLLFTASILDCADGQLARSKGISSPAGRLLDGVVDFVVTVGVYIAAAGWLAEETGDGRMWTLASIAGALMFVRATVYDSIKNKYNRVVYPSAAEGNETPAEVWAQARAAYQRGHILDGFMLTLYVCHSPFFGWLGEKLLHRERGAHETPMYDAQTRARFQAAYKPAVRAWSTLGISTHLFVLSLGLVLSWFSPRYLEGAFWLMVVPLSFVMLAALWLQTQAWWRFRRGEPHFVGHDDRP